MAKDTLQDAQDLLTDPKRLAALSRTGLLDSGPEESFDRFTRLAAQLLDAPVALVSLVDHNRQYFKSAYGLGEPWASKGETPLSHSFCQHTLGREEPLIIQDAREDTLVCENLAIPDLNVVAYAGVPLRTREGDWLGSFCIIDTKPRAWADREIDVLKDLAAAVMTEIELRQAAVEARSLRVDAERADREKMMLLNATDEGIYGIDPKGRCTFINAPALLMLGYDDEAELLGRDMHEAIHHSHANGAHYPVETCPIYRAFHKGQTVRIEGEMFWRRDGTSFPVRYASAPILSDGGAVGAVITFSDLTEQQRQAAFMEEMTEQRRLALEAAQAGTWDFDIESNLASWDERSRAVFGVAGESISYEDIFKLIHPEDRERVDASVQEALDPATPGEYYEEYRVLRPDGEERWVAAKGQAYFEGVDEARHPARFIGTVTDITKRKRAEVALQESEARYRDLLEHLPVGVYRTTPQGDMEEGNSALIALLGYKNKEELRKHNVKDLYFDDAARVSHLEQLQDDATRNAEFRLRNAHGEMVWVRDYPRVVEDSEGHVAFFDGVLVDITERKRAEEALKENELRKSAILESSLDAIITVDADSRIVEFNAAAEEIFGYDREAVLGQPMAPHIIPPHMREAHHNGMDHYLATGEGPVFGQRIELPAMRADGSEFPAELAINPIVLESGEQLFTAFLRDITEQKEAAEALKESEQRLRFTLEAAHVGTWEWNIATNEVRWSDNLEAIHGLPPGAFGSSFDSFLEDVHPDDRGPVQEAIAAAIEGDGTYHLEYRLPPRDGNEQQWIETKGRVTTDEAGQPVRMAGICMNVTYRKSAEEALRQSEERYRFLANVIPQQIWTARPDGELDYVNQVVLDYFGRSLEKMIGEGWQDVLHSDDLTRAVEQWTHCLETGEPYEIEFRLLRTDGQYRWHLARARAQQDSDGRIVQWFGSNTDIHDRKETQEAFRRSEERLRLATEAAQLGTWDYDLVNDVLRWDDRCKALFGLSPEANIDYDTFLAGIHPDDRARTDRIVQGVLSPGSDGFYSTEFRTLGLEDGVERWIAAQGQVFFDQQGQAARFVGTVLDISELKEAEAAMARAKEAAEAANRAKSQFLANMSHELRTPLNAVIGYSELLQEEAEDEGLETFLPELEKIHAAGRQLLALVNDVLDLSKIEAGKMELNLRTFDLARALEEVVAGVEHQANENGNELKIDVSPEIGAMRADETKVRQALLNFLGNAVKFTKDGEVRLTVAKEQEDDRDWLVFTVADTGIGMTQEQVDNLFQSFYRGEDPHIREYEGTGLGLAITWRLCQMMGGRIDVASERGVGTTFTMRLPERMAPSAGEAAPHKPFTFPSAGDGQGGSATILVIDDDPNMRELLGQFLTREGFHVETAPNGRAGIEMARKLRPLAITTDVLMPEMDGWEVLTALKSDPDLADIPVIMVTMVDNERRAYTLGASEFMTKPVDRRRLGTVLRRLCRNGGDCTALVVDDDDGTRDLVRRTLEAHGYQISEAVNGREALQQLVKHQPSVILLDLMMPEMDGFELVEELRKHAEWRKIPIVVMTAKDLTREDRRRLNGCVQAILQKGTYSREELLHEVHARVMACTTREQREG